MTRGPVVNKKA